ncbi:integrase, catalytic region, zinc finger, CCHC-type containing protein [Tanacetum coccineum]
MACDVSWMSKLTKLSDENVLLKNQVDLVVQERENIKLKYGELFNSIKAIWVQHQREVNELIENITQKAYAYGDTIEKLLCVTPLNTNTTVKAKKVSNTEVKADRSKSVTSQSTPKNDSNSVKRPKSKDTKLKNRVLKITNVKSPSTNAQKVSRSVSVAPEVQSTSVVAKSRFSVAKTLTATNKVSSALSLSPKSSQSGPLSLYMKNKIETSKKWQKWFEHQQSLNWSPKSKTTQSTPSVSKSSTTVIRLILWIGYRCSKHMTGNLQLLRIFIEKFVRIVHFENDHFATITGYGDFGEYLLTDSRDSNIYTISISEVAASSPVCLMSKATSIKSWLWHRRLSHLNFGSINHLMKKDLVDGLPKSMASECNNLGPRFNCLNFQDSLENSQSVPLKEDLDNLFGPLYEEYYVTITLKVSYNCAANTLENEDTPSSSLIVVDENEAPQIVTSSEEPIANEATTSVSNENANEQIQEDVAAFDINDFYNPFHSHVLEEAESSSTF